MPQNFQNELNVKFRRLHRILKNEGNTWLGPGAHGANTLRIIYPPEHEKVYLDRLREEFPDEGLIDVSSLFVDVIDYWLNKHPKPLSELFEHHTNIENKLFQSGDSEEPNLLQKVISAIQDCDEKDETPILYRVGVLHGTNIQLGQIVDRAGLHRSNPLVIFYPATPSDRGPQFLDLRTSSDYKGVSF